MKKKPKEGDQKTSENMGVPNQGTENGAKNQSPGHEVSTPSKRLCPMWGGKDHQTDFRVKFSLVMRRRKEKQRCRRGRGGTGPGPCLLYNLQRVGGAGGGGEKYR